MIISLINQLLLGNNQALKLSMMNHLKFDSIIKNNNKVRNHRKLVEILNK